MRQPAVYIMASQRNGTLYIGVTSNLAKRIYVHKEGLVEGFSKKYCCKRLVHYEAFDDMYEAITREKCLKGWLRKRKLKLIEEHNPEWQDLYELLV